MRVPSDRAAALSEIVAQAGAIAKRARETLKRELKPDGSIVTNADREVELYLRSQLAAFAPATACWGEEFGFEEPGPEGLWVVDPVDGTSNFSFGSPLWGVSVALVKEGSIPLGCVYLPDLGEMYVAESGKGAFVNGVRVAPIPPGHIRDEELVGFDDGLLRSHPGLRPPGKMRLSGAFVVDGVYTCMQRYRGMIGRRERLYDIAACLLMGQECSADIRYADGSAFDIAALCKPVQINRAWLIFPQESGFFIQGSKVGS